MGINCEKCTHIHPVDDDVIYICTNENSENYREYVSLSYGCDDGEEDGR